LSTAATRCRARGGEKRPENMSDPATNSHMSRHDDHRVSNDALVTPPIGRITRLTVSSPRSATEPGSSSMPIFVNGWTAFTTWNPKAPGGSSVSGSDVRVRPRPCGSTTKRSSAAAGGGKRRHSGGGDQVTKPRPSHTPRAGVTRVAPRRRAARCPYRGSPPSGWTKWPKLHIYVCPAVRRAVGMRDRSSQRFHAADGRNPATYPLDGTK